MRFATTSGGRGLPWCPPTRIVARVIGPRLQGRGRQAPAARSRARFARSMNHCGGVLSGPHAAQPKSRDHCDSGVRHDRASSTEGEEPQLSTVGQVTLISPQPSNRRPARPGEFSTAHRRIERASSHRAGREPCERGGEKVRLPHKATMHQSGCCGEMPDAGRYTSLGTESTARRPSLPAGGTSGLLFELRFDRRRGRS